MPWAGLGQRTIQRTAIERTGRIGARPERGASLAGEVGRHKPCRTGPPVVVTAREDLRRAGPIMVSHSERDEHFACGTSLLFGVLRSLSRQAAEVIDRTRISLKNFWMIDIINYRRHLRTMSGW